MKATFDTPAEMKEKMEHLRYESFLNAVEEAFKQTKTGIRTTDLAMLKFADQVIGNFAAIYANTRPEELGRQVQEIILSKTTNYN